VTDVNINLKCPERAVYQFPSATSRSVSTGVADFDNHTSSPWPLKMGPIGCPETSVTNYQHTLRKLAEELQISYRHPLLVLVFQCLSYSCALCFNSIYRFNSFISSTFFVPPESEVRADIFGDRSPSNNMENFRLVQRCHDLSVRRCVVKVSSYSGFDKRVKSLSMPWGNMEKKRYRSTQS
jgi:hypothetical protein